MSGEQEQGPVSPQTPEAASVARARGKARRLAMQALYQWQMTGDDIAGIKQQFFDANDMRKVDTDYFDELVSGVVADVSTLDTLLEAHMSRSMASVDPVERAILRMAACEFVRRHDVPYKVILNEAVNITKKFCAANSHTFVNAVLDKAAHVVRKLETGIG